MMMCELNLWCSEGLCLVITRNNLVNGCVAQISCRSEVRTKADLSPHVFVSNDTYLNIRFWNAVQSSIGFSDDGRVLDALQYGSH